MKTLNVKEDKLSAYTYDMIRYAVYKHPEEVIHILQNNGVEVPQDADYKVLHAMTLKAVASSQSFSNDLQQLLHAIAMDEQYSKYRNMTGEYSNADGAPTDTTTCCDQSYLQQIFNPKTVDTLLTGGLALVNSQLNKGGKSAINNQVNDPATPPPDTPPPAKAKSNTGVIIAITVVALGVGGYLYYRSKHGK